MTRLDRSEVMRAGQWRSRLAGLVLTGMALVWIVPIHHAHAIDAPIQPAAPAHLEWFNPDRGEPTLSWTPIERTEITSERVVLLVHGLDEPGSVWDALAPELASHEWTAIRFEYPNDQAIALSADQFDAALTDLRTMGVKEVWIVAHSMGGLVTLDALTREGFNRSGWPGVRRVVTLGTPMGGSLLAPVRAIAELREHAIRAVRDGELNQNDLDGMRADGSGEAGADLNPGSDFLVDLQSRERPEGIPITAVVADVPKPDAAGITNALLSNMPDVVADEPEARRAARDFGSWASRWIGEAVDLIGDGVVDADSGRSAWTDDIVPVRALHRSMITRMPCPVRGDVDPPAIQIVLDRLARDRALDE